MSSVVVLLAVNLPALPLIMCILGTSDDDGSAFCEAPSVSVYDPNATRESHLSCEPSFLAACPIFQTSSGTPTAVKSTAADNAAVFFSCICIFSLITCLQYSVFRIIRRYAGTDLENTVVRNAAALAVTSSQVFFVLDRFWLKKLEIDL